MRFPLRGSLASVFLGILASFCHASDPISTPRIESFPDQPKGYRLIDWRDRSESFVRFALDPTRQGEFLPLMWWDDTQLEGRQTTFGLPSYVGMTGQWNVFRNAHEAFVTTGTVLSGTWLGIDMSAYPVPGSPSPVNLVSMQNYYFSNRNQIFSDLINGHEPTGQTFFYELSPSLFIAPLVDRYPQEVPLSDSWKRSCETWSQVASHLWRLNDYSFQSYDIHKKTGVVQDWKEPDVAAGLAYLMMIAHQKWKDDRRFYDECHHALMWMDQHPKNINYGIFAPFGVYAAARANAEHGSKYNIAKFFSWCFESSDVRGLSPHARNAEEGDDYGIVSGGFGEFDVAGLVGASRIELLSQAKQSQGKGYYVFAMETFANAWPLVPAVRYEDRLARAVGKWMHHAAHSARYFYPDQLPSDMQTDWLWASMHSTAIPYEGIKNRNCETGKEGPYGCGDPTIHGWGPSNLGLYSGCLSGVFGAIIQPTSHPDVLALNLNVTDLFAPESFPTRLLYNPKATEVEVVLEIESKPVAVWDTVSNVLLCDRVVDGKVKVKIPPDQAVVLVLIPADHSLHVDHHRLTADGKIVDYRIP